MHVLIVNKHFTDKVGGSETQCHGIAERLLRMGHEVTYAACSPAKASYPTSYSVAPLADPLAASFRQLLDRVRPDVVYWRYNKRCLLRCAIAARLRGVTFVYAVSHINDVDLIASKPPMTGGLSWHRRFARYGRWLRSLTLSGINSLAFGLLSGAVLQHRGQDTRLIRVPKRVIYNSSYADPADPDVDPPFDQYVLWVGSIKKSKNPDDYIALARRMQSLPVKFLMVGEIQDRHYAPRIQQACDSLPNFAYLGLQPQSRVSALMANCICLAHTCAPEGFPNVFVQAWTLGKPVVSLHFDPDDLLKSEGLGFHSGNSEAFASDVCLLVRDDARRLAIGNRARAFALTRFNAATNVDILVDFMVKLTAGAGRD